MSDRAATPNPIYNGIECIGAIQLDPVNSDDHLAVSVTSKHGHGFVMLSRAEAARLSHQIERWLAWDRSRQGAPRQYFMRVKDLLRRRPEWFGRARSNRDDGVMP